MNVLTRGFLYRFKDRAVNWFEAREYCWSLGSNLVEIDSSFENDAIVEELRKHTWGWERKQFWMGLTDRQKEGFWVVESTGKEPGFTNWAWRQPPQGHW